MCSSDLLLRFNAKFSPRWQPRYLLYERRSLGFARAGLAAMTAEGQLPRIGGAGRLRAVLAGSADGAVDARLR